MNEDDRIRVKVGDRYWLRLTKEEADQVFHQLWEKRVNTRESDSWRDPEVWMPHMKN